MEKLKMAVSRISSIPPRLWLTNLSASELSLIPLLSLVSSLYSAAVRLRHYLYILGVLRKHRLPVPVISVGNLTWGGNGKTPMVEFLARAFADDGISPLILTRGYGGADEAKMLQRQLQGTSAKVGVGANRAAIASRFLERYGCAAFNGATDRPFTGTKSESLSTPSQIGVAILDDGMQHLSIQRDLEIVMVNALMPWGNHHLLPLGPLREPLTALGRANIVVIHHADLIPEEDVDALESTILQVQESVPIFHTKMAPINFFSCQDTARKMPLNAVAATVFLCLSGIGSADSFIKRIERLGPAHVDRLDFSDHHKFQLKDIEMVQARLRALESKFGTKPIVIVTEKDYDRSPEAFEYLKPYEVLAVCCRLQVLRHNGTTEDTFKKIIKLHLCQSGRVFHGVVTNDDNGGQRLASPCVHVTSFEGQRRAVHRRRSDFGLSPAATCVTPLKVVLPRFTLARILQN
ncbi:probable tetraacyldisaccharide 4'-kinase, mitochondrial [Andrographis paniculata]|uniref:probable tetraacyldisaccharide 4'-kinase, mitochondrial n=1 Tax=Andrographis paniculata TaxID=175694 RepID=UPI0021E7265B|nr:probable tetraacyldisaccharide 4'-kinase, mitochondrial [Andrographis paniculata]